MKGPTLESRRAGAKQGIRTRKERFGSECHREWGLKGGNPVLIEQGRWNRERAAREAAEAAEA
jgi:hypothetical protein